MKTKLLLLLCLLVPSLGFGVSGMIRFDSDDNKVAVVVVETSLDDPFDQVVATFDLEDGKCDPKQNELDLEKLRMVFSKLFPKKNKVRGQIITEGNLKLRKWKIVELQLQGLIIENGYAITHIEKPIKEAKVIYFYKADSNK